MNLPDLTDPVALDQFAARAYAAGRLPESRLAEALAEALEDLAEAQQDLQDLQDPQDSQIAEGNAS